MLVLQAHLPRGLASAPISLVARHWCSSSSKTLSNHDDGVPLRSPTYLVWGANTGVGKTLASAGLAHAAQRLKVPLLYLKPVQTGFPADSDARLVALASGTELSLGPHAAEQAAIGSASITNGCNTRESHDTNHTHNTTGSSNSSSSSTGTATSRELGTGHIDDLRVCRVEHAWGAPVSPHLAVQLEGRAVSDGVLCEGVTQQLWKFNRQLQDLKQQCHSRTHFPQQQQHDQQHGHSLWQQPQAGAPGSAFSEGHLQRLATHGLALVESAGGVASPSPSGKLMCDVLRPLRLPAILVGDPRLGGISSTISAYESLLLRGYDTALILFMDQPTPAHTCSSLTNAAPSTNQQKPSTLRATASMDQPSPSTSWPTQPTAVPHPPPSPAPIHQAPAYPSSTAIHGTNAQAVHAHLAQQLHLLGRPGPKVVSIPACPPPPPSGASAEVAAQTAVIQTDNGLDASLSAWLEDTAPHFDALLAHLSEAHAARMAYLHSMRSRATSTLWWPFTQHGTLQAGGIQVIDSRWGDRWLTLAGGNSDAVMKQNTTGSSSSSSSSHMGSKQGSNDGMNNSSTCSSSVGEEGSGKAPPSSAMVPLHDACSSWWTQASTPEHHAELSRAVAYATGRYLHVMFPENVHQAALEAAEQLLHVVGGTWAKRVFFSDDGSTAVEVALKMAFRTYMQQRGLDAGGQQNDGSPIELQVVGLANAYHGDTLGAMDCVPPSPFNGPAQAPWYRGRGLFFEPPYVAMEKGEWRVQPQPPWWDTHTSAGTPSWASLHDVLSPERDGSKLAHSYRRWIEHQLDEHKGRQASNATGRTQGRLAALVMEPLVQGAGGMLMVDPQFQRELVHACRARGMVVVFDEVMTGGFRLGAPTAASLLCLKPDIACFAKLVTGGVLPMAATLTTEHVFKAFEGDSKLQALLHGHSYTAYPAGCAAIVAALNILTNPAHNPNLAPQLGKNQASQQEAKNASCPHSSGLDYDQRSTAGAKQQLAALPGVCRQNFLQQQRQQQQRQQQLKGVWPEFCSQWTPGQQGNGSGCAPVSTLQPLWCEKTVVGLSHHPAVARLVSVGTLLAVQVRTPQQHTQSSTAPINSYASSAGGALRVARLLRDSHGIFARPLGDVVYIMVPPTTPRATCDRLLAGLQASLQQYLTRSTNSLLDQRDGYVV